PRPRGTLRVRSEVTLRRIPLATLAACAPQLGVPTEPLSLAGYEPVTLDLSDTTVLAADVERVVIGGVAAYGIEAASAQELVVRVQGAPVPGPQPVELHVGDEVHRFEDALTFAPPLDPRFGTIVALGASITE